jgi:hypothetical protein
VTRGGTGGGDARNGLRGGTGAGDARNGLPGGTGGGDARTGSRGGAGGSDPRTCRRGRSGGSFRTSTTLGGAGRTISAVSTNIDACAVALISRASTGTVVSSSIHIGTPDGYGEVTTSLKVWGRLLRTPDIVLRCRTW